MKAILNSKHGRLKFKMDEKQEPPGFFTILITANRQVAKGVEIGREIQQIAWAKFNKTITRGNNIYYRG